MGHTPNGTGDEVVGSYVGFVGIRVGNCGASVGIKDGLIEGKSEGIIEGFLDRKVGCNVGLELFEADEFDCSDGSNLMGVSILD